MPSAITGRKRIIPFFYGYVIVALASLSNLVLGGTNYTFSVFFEPLSSEFGWTRAVTSGAFSMYMFVHGSLFILTGRLTDRLGPRVIMSGCGLFMGLGFILMSTTHALWQIYLFYGIVIAMGMSGGYVPMISTVTRWFENNSKLGLMIGISIAGVGIGTMIMPPLANWLIDTYGWRTSYVVIGLIVLVSIMTAAQFMKPAPKQLPLTADSEKAAAAEIKHGGLSLRGAVKTGQFWLLATTYFSFGLVLQAIIVHIVLHALDLGISATTAASIFVAIGAMSLTSRLVMGAASDRIGNRSVIVISLVLMAAATSWLLVARQSWALFIFAIVFGFAYGGMVSAQSQIVAELFGIRSHGVILGVIVSLVTLGSAIGPMMSGIIFDTVGNYYPSFIICVAFSIIGLATILLVKPVLRGGKANDEGRSPGINQA